MRVRRIVFGGGSPFDPGRCRARRDGLLRSTFDRVLLLPRDIGEGFERSSDRPARRRITDELEEGDRHRRRIQACNAAVRMFVSDPGRGTEADASRFHGATNFYRTGRFNICDCSTRAHLHFWFRPFISDPALRFPPRAVFALNSSPYLIIL